MEILLLITYPIPKILVPFEPSQSQGRAISSKSCLMARAMKGAIHCVAMGHTVRGRVHKVRIDRRAMYA